MSSAELLLAEQLRQAGIVFEREVRFAPPRRWRADFRVGPLILTAEHRSEIVIDFSDLLVEIDGGGFTGGHRRFGRMDEECEKGNAATLMGYRTLHFTPAMVEDGRALQVIRQALGLAEVAA